MASTVSSRVYPCFTAKFLAAQKKEEKEEKEAAAAGTAVVKTKHVKKAEAKMGPKGRKARRFAGSKSSDSGEVDAAVEAAAAAERALVEPGLGEALQLDRSKTRAESAKTGVSA